ncbi:NAD-dependent epimerase/dehydratase family protein [Pelorhabdus rhamnosifermentans]|uniref:NAD-dependent epimerase/dehydratase family protein n=1 Tax=Pelorhabdus rhamnosifermentans TaxID=2772457 RepID=UPI001C06350A|nr:SDR family oxidoreductase [Pelorhabdus rhamnosifermentans]
MLSVLNGSDDYRDITCFALTSKKIENCICINHKNYTYTKEKLLNSGLTHVDAVIHLGAFTPKDANESDNLRGAFANIKNTLHLIENLPNKPSKFIFISSTSVYPCSDSVIDESVKEEPESMYGDSKLYCEKMIGKYCNDNNINYQILRLGPIYGKGEETYKRLITITLKRLVDNIPPYIVNGGEIIRSFIHVSDVCNIILKSLKLEKPVGPINVVSNQEYKIADLIQLCITVSQRKLKPENVHTEMPDKHQRFNNEKMLKWLDCEHVKIWDGLYEEYAYILNKCCPKDS